MVNARYGNSPAIDKVRAMVAVVRGRTATTGIGKRTVNKYQDHEGNDIAMTAIAAKINERLKVAEGSPGAVTASLVKANLPQVMSDIEHYATINVFEPGTRSAPVQETTVGEDGMPTFVGDYMRSEGIPANQVASTWANVQRAGKAEGLVQEAEQWRRSRGYEVDAADSHVADGGATVAAEFEALAQGQEQGRPDSDGAVSDTDTDPNVNISSHGRGEGAIGVDSAEYAQMQRQLGTPAEQKALQAKWDTASTMHAPIHERTGWSERGPNNASALNIEGRLAFKGATDKGMDLGKAYKLALAVSEATASEQHNRGNLGLGEASGEASARTLEAHTPEEATAMLNQQLPATGVTPAQLDTLRGHYGLPTTGQATIEPELGAKLQPDIVRLGLEGKTAFKNTAPEVKTPLFSLGAGRDGAGSRVGVLSSGVEGEFSGQWGQQPLVSAEDMPKAERLAARAFVPSANTVRNSAREKIKTASEAGDYEAVAQAQATLDATPNLSGEENSRAKAAIANALNSPSANIVRWGRDNVTDVIFDDLGKGNEGLYSPTEGKVYVTRDALADDSPENKAHATATTIHEFSHAFDYGAGDGDYASSLPTSPFNVRVGADGGFEFGAAAQELYDASQGIDLDLVKALDQAFGAVSSHLAGERVVGEDKNPVVAAGRSAREAFARAVELYNRDPALLKTDAPITHGIIESINRAESKEQAQNILRGDNGKQQGSTAARGGGGKDASSRTVAGDQSGVQGGSGYVVQHAQQPGAAADVEAHDGSAVQQPDNGQAGPAPDSQAAGVGSEAAGRSGSQGADPVTTAVARDLGFDSVDEMPPVTRVEGMKGWINSVMQHKWRTKPGVLGMVTPEQLGKVFKHAQVKRFTDTNNRMASRLHEIQQAAGRIIKHWDGLARRHGKVSFPAGFKTGFQL